MMSKFSIIFVFNFILFFSNATIAQIEADTLLAYQYYKQADSLKSANALREAVLFFEKASDAYKEENLTERYLTCINELSILTRTLGDYDESIHYGEELRRSSILKFGQNNEWEAKAYNLIGSVHLFKLNLTKALEYLKKAIAIMEDKLNTENLTLISSYNIMGSVYYRLGDYKKSLDYYKLNLKLSNRILGEDHRMTGISLKNIGNIYVVKGEFENGIQNYHKSLPVYKEQFGDSSLHVASIYHAIGTTYSYMSLLDSALFYLDKSLMIRQGILGNEHQSVLSSTNNIGNIYSRWGNISKSLEYYQKALEIGKKILPENHDLMGIAYSNIGKNLQSLGSSDQAITYHRKSLDIFKNLYGENHEKISASYFHHCLYFLEKRQYDTALYYARKAEAIGKLTIGENHPNVAINTRYIGIIHRYLGNHELSLEYLKRATSSYKLTFGEDLHIYRDIADTYFEMGKYDSAAAFYEKSANGIDSTYGSRNPYTNRIEGLARIYSQKRLYDKALKAVQDGLITNSWSFSDKSLNQNPSIKDIIDKKNALALLLTKAQLLEKKNIKDKKKDNLYSIMTTIYSCDSLIDQMRRFFLSYEDKLNLGETAATVYEIGTRTSLQLSQGQDSSAFSNKAFYFSEKGKAGVLRQSLSEQLLKSYSGIPDDLLDIEKRFIADIFFYRSQIEKYQKNNDSTLVEKWKKLLFDTSRALDSLTFTYERDYPAYYDLKFKGLNVDIDEIQRTISPGSAILEYLTGDSTFYTFVITQNHFKIFQQPASHHLEEKINSFRLSIEGDLLNEKPAQAFTFFIREAHTIFEEVLGEPIKFLETLPDVHQLVVIPDGPLHYLPFEILLRKLPGSSVNTYDKLDYLINDFTVRYSYSATLDVFDHQKHTEASQIRYLGYGPSYRGDTPDSIRSLALGRFRNSVSGLKWNQEEVTHAGQLMKGDYHLGQEATESSFKESVDQYDVIHLAMHALVDDQDPMNSKLVFSQENDSINDGFLHTYELFNMNMNPELVVLSACNTGYGGLKKGEGMMSLAYGFQYAGTPSTVVSQWQVDDRSTSDLMQLFYTNLSEGQAKHEALRNAKLSYLKNANSTYSHPFYWGGFVLIGDEKPAVNRDNRLYYLIPLTLLLILLLYYMYNRSRKRI